MPPRPVAAVEIGGEAEYGVVGHFHRFGVGLEAVAANGLSAAPICGQQRAPRWWLIGRSEDGTYCKIVVIWRPSAFDLVGRNIWTPRRNFAV